MPESSKVARCVKSVERKGGVKGPYAACVAATGQAYQTGRKPKEKRKK